MRILYLGDCHGRTNELGSVVQSTDAKQDAVIVQVGDFGFGFPDKQLESWMEKRAYRKKAGKYNTPIFTCAGNHDNWDQLLALHQFQKTDVVEMIPNSECYYVHRGTTIDIFGINHLFFGGALSTDQYRRKSGVDWWTREEPSYLETNNFFTAFDELKPNTVITHEAPARIDLHRADRTKSSTVRDLENTYLISEHRPEFHYFGHHHLLEEWKIDGTTFACCGLHGEYHERIING